MPHNDAPTLDATDGAVLDLLRQGLAKALRNAGLSRDTDNVNLLEVGVIDSQRLLDLILDVEGSSGRVFDPTRIDFESGVTLAKLAGAFI
ncbi:hypothetical protein [Dankookia sp. P2]|uniref:hypothetical protein n=1 Tax=Dankookia sp. P2 TaxID=3423955 RepID=UPI003D66E15E